MSIAELLERHFQAYNDHELDAFLATMSDHVELITHPNPESTLRGKEAVRTHYRDKRFCIPDLRSELLSRVICGSTAVDHERIFGLGPEPIEAVLAYDVEDGLIARVRVLATGPSTVR